MIHFRVLSSPFWFLPCFNPSPIPFETFHLLGRFRKNNSFQIYVEWDFTLHFTYILDYLLIKKDRQSSCLVFNVRKIVALIAHPFSFILFCYFLSHRVTEWNYYDKLLIHSSLTDRVILQFTSL